MKPPIDAMFDGLLDLAKGVAQIIPNGDLITKGVAIGEKIVDIIDDVMDDAPSPGTQDKLREARRELADAVKVKAKATADRLRGE